MSTEAQSSQEITRGLVRRELAWPDLFKLMRDPKSTNRFDEMIAAVQEMVTWKNQILLPLGENLFIVAKNGKAIVKTMAGAELCAWNENWKMKCRVRIKKSKADFKKVFPNEHMNIDPQLVEIREWICPKSGMLLDVDCVPPTYPVEIDFTPDLKVFYTEWLGRKLPVKL